MLAEEHTNEPDTTVTELVTAPPNPPTQSTTMGMVELSDTPANIAAKFDKYEELRSLILKDSDFYEIMNKAKTKVVGYGVGKTGLYKLGVAFNLTTLIASEKKITKPDDPEYLAYQTTVQCSAPNGRLVMEVGFCDNTDKDRHGESEHIIRAMAKTRATERAYVVMTGETGKKGDFKARVKIPPLCQCSKDNAKVGLDGKCKTCGAVDKTYFEHHKEEFRC